MTGTTTSGTIVNDLTGETVGESAVRLAAENKKLRHDLANAECSARLIEEAYDRTVLKYEAQLAALRESVDKLTTG